MIVVALGIGDGMMRLCGIGFVGIVHPPEINLVVWQRRHNAETNGGFQSGFTGDKTSIVMIEYTAFDPIPNIITEYRDAIQL